MISLILSLTRREIAGRYRGSLFGLLWSLLTPLLMLAIYTFVFGVVIRARWSTPSGASAEHSTAEFAVILFAGLMMFQFFSESVGSSPGLIVNNKNYVKKIVFPVKILPVVSAGACLFHTLISLGVLLVFVWGVYGFIPWTAILAPLVLAPLVLLSLGLSWLLAAAGVYFRDIGQVVPPLLTAMMFLSPIFFPRTALPDWLQPYLSLNPLTIPVESLREVAVFGRQPDWSDLGLYAIAAVAVAVLGERFFQAVRRGFADVL